ncbi:dephospho-CoA kinase [Candidatus Neomarinimicrobiota bacterium]
MLKIGLTGGIGSGKSTASSFLAKLGSYVFDTDTEAKIILDNNEDVQNNIIEEFGSDVLGHNGLIDNTKLAKVAFQDEDHQIILNSIIHPFVFRKLDKQFDRILSQNNHASFIVDGALIFESGLDQHLDSVLLIASSLKYRIARALNRGTLSKEEILRRIELQWTDEDKAASADYTIYNNGTEQELEEKIKIFHSEHL